MTEEPNPFLLCKRAAAGDLATQRQLADAAESCLSDGDEWGFIEGLTYARMAAANGNSEDKLRVIRLLAASARLAESDGLATVTDIVGQQVAYSQAALAQMQGAEADDYSEHLNRLMDTAGREEMACGKYYYDLLRQAEKGDA